jgi:hypothetical protein
MAVKIAMAAQALLTISTSPQRVIADADERCMPMFLRVQALDQRTVGAFGQGVTNL